MSIMQATPDLATRDAVARLAELCPLFTAAASREKQQLLELLAGRRIRAAYLLRQLHGSLCYLCAFPDNGAIYRAARLALTAFAERVQALSDSQLALLEDSGIAGTRIRYPFAYANVAWLVGQFTEHVEIDWNSTESTEKLDTLLQLLASPAEQPVFEEQALAADDYLRLARDSHNTSELQRFFGLCDVRPQTEKFIETLYDPPAVQVIWNLKDCRGSRTHNYLPARRIFYRKGGMRRPGKRPEHDIIRPMAVTHLSRREGAMLLDVAKAALLVRSREVYHFQYGSPDAVYLASAGRGIQIAFFGALPERRFNLDVSFGYMVFANGMPVAYGGISPLFNQGNTGLNVLDEYRRGESAFLYSQVLRMGHSLFGCRRFIVNPYQFGEDNAEALRSGAFWFYYRLGFRPVDEHVRTLAEREFTRLATRRGRRSPLALLKQLASCDMHLLLPGGGKTAVFEECWLSTLALGAAKLIACQGLRHRQAVSAIARDIATRLNIRNTGSWNAGEREQLRRLAPVFGLIPDLDRWSRAEKRALAAIIRAKAAPSERQYARLMARHSRLQSSLRRYCKISCK